MAENIKRDIPVGVLFSHSGPYEKLGYEGYCGAMAAIQAVNDRALPFNLVPLIADPSGNPDRYAPLSEELISQQGVKHIVGCTTSWSRKEVIPVVEKRDALLWYPCVYEGFEASDRVVYVAACANQHLVPLINFIVPRFGNRAILLGSNYIWGWESNRLAREMLNAAGGEVLGERAIAIGDTDIDHLIREIESKKPDFILNNLIGESSYTFLRAYAELGRRNSDFRTSARPVLSCNLYESELELVGSAAEGNYSVSCYFRTLPGETNRAFLEAVRHNGFYGSLSAIFAQAYSSVLMIAAGIERAGTDDVEKVLAAVQTQATGTPLGDVLVEPRTNHIALPAHIGRARQNCSFEIVHESKVAIQPDPFMARTHLQTSANPGQQSGFLRLVK
ncbi:MAG TPA: transporter substrate-binding domain-containing protein [Ochrobactrum sp.]|nr:transporter substrate-binding domain-containing protein [Ochrobactrum sp.]